MTCCLFPYALCWIWPGKSYPRWHAAHSQTHCAGLTFHSELESPSRWHVDRSHMHCAGVALERVNQSSTLPIHRCTVLELTYHNKLVRQDGTLVVPICIVWN